MKKIIISVALVALSLPAASIAGSGSSSAERTCHALRAGMGAQAFKDLYGTNHNKSNAFGKCVSKIAKAQAHNQANAKSECRAEQSDPNFAAGHDGKTFDQFYGTGNGHNAYGKCVSAKAKAKNAADQKATISAAKTCKAERKADPAAFKAKWGTNHNKSNAFGKCVSKTAKD
jgi:hypothetical protein